MILLYYIIDTGAFLDLVTAFPVDSATILRFSPAFGGGERVLSRKLKWNCCKKSCKRRGVNKIVQYLHRVLGMERTDAAPALS